MIKRYIECQSLRKYLDERFKKIRKVRKNSSIYSDYNCGYFDSIRDTIDDIFMNQTVVDFIEIKEV